MAPFITDKVFELIQSKDTLTAAAAIDPTTPIDKLAEKLYKGHKSDNQKLVVGTPELTQADLDRAAQCGRFTERPSDLFLQVRRLLSYQSEKWN